MTTRHDDSALVERAKSALLNGRPELAAEVVAQAVASPPRDAVTLRTLAHVAVVLRDEAAAAELLDLAIAAAAPEPAPADWYRVLGEMRAGQGRLNDALRALRAAVAQKPDETDTWRWLGRVLRRVDDVPAAVAAYRRAVELAPQQWPGLVDLAVALTDARAFDEAVVHFDAAAALAGDMPAVIVGRAKLDAQCGRRSEAIVALQACVARHPSSVPALAELALALRDEGRFDDAIATFRLATARVPAEAAFWCGLGRTLLEAGRADEALRVAASYLERRPGHAGALSLEVLARQALGDEAGVRRLLDYEHFVVQRQLPLPDGFADLHAFNDALASAAQHHPTLHQAPLRHATAAGLHSGSLLIDAPPVISSFQGALQLAIADYVRALPDWPDHPFVAHKPQAWGLDVWCVVMQRQGHQVPHIHPEAWLSGAYYPKLPEAWRSAHGHDGWLAFGEADRNFPRHFQLPPVRVRPKEGLLVLFPSYFFHHTTPLETEGTRISVAFDLVPAQ